MLDLETYQKRLALRAMLDSLPRPAEVGSTLISANADRTEIYELLENLIDAEIDNMIDSIIDEELYQ